MIRMLVVGSVIFVSLGLTGCFSKQFFSSEKKPEVCFEKRCFDVEIADTSEKRQRGLMFRESLSKKSGMLFVYDTPLVSKFRMKNTKIPLDMIWLSRTGVVIYIEHGAPPCLSDPCPNYGPSDKEALYVLEIGSGVAKKANIEPGTVAKISY